MATPPLSDLLARQALEVYEKHDHSNKKAARELGLNIDTFRSRVVIAKQRGFSTSAEAVETLHGWNPDCGLTHVIPEPLIVKGTSTLYGADGKQKLQWLKTTKSDKLISDMVTTLVTSLSKEFEGMSPLVARPKTKNAVLLSTYVLGDPHFGLYSWKNESGDDFDTAIARRVTIAAIDRLVTSAPASDCAVLLSVGDSIHGDNQANTTAAGTGLDVDTRYAKVLEVTIDTFRHLILRLLEKHKHVAVRLVKGNHDTHSHLSLAFALKGYFNNNKRVEIDISPADFWYYRFGKVLIGATHGDKTKQENLLGVMVSDRPMDVGETKHRYFFTGHVHHQVVKEFQGLTCESFQTLAPKDAWHAGKGYRSGRSMMCIVHHKEHGEIERHRCDIGMVE